MGEFQLTDYEETIHSNIWHKLEEGKWYTIQEERPDKESFISAIKKFIDIWGCVEFNADYSKFRRFSREHPIFSELHNKNLCLNFRLPPLCDFQNTKVNLDKMKQHDFSLIQQQLIQSGL